MAKRSGKFYRKNEREVMEQLGLKPTVNSGSGWIEKEDGQNDAVICQLKSTDAQSITVKLDDIKTLQYNAQTEHKLPVFAIQFLQSNEVFVLVSPEDLTQVSKYLRDGSKPRHDEFFDEISQIEDTSSTDARRMITSSNNAREQVRNEMQSKNKKKIRSAT